MESFNNKISFLNIQNYFGKENITLELIFEKEVNCKILFDTNNNYFNKSV